MGLFDFVKDIGQKLFDREEDASEEIEAHINADNPGVENAKVTFKDGVATLSGNAANQAALEKAVLMAGNVRGVTEVRVEGVEVAAQAQPERVEYYTIVAGDTLSGIAKKFYGKAMQYPRIFEANREVIKDPDKIYVGQKIRIPLD